MDSNLVWEGILQKHRGAMSWHVAPRSPGMPRVAQMQEAASHPFSLHVGPTVISALETPEQQPQAGQRVSPAQQQVPLV